MSGKLQQKIISDSTSLASSKQLELMMIIIAGVAAILLHKVLRWPLDMPGRHGLEFMAIFVYLRAASSMTWAATIAATSAAITTSMVSYSGGVGIAMIILIAQGLIMDVMYKHLTLRGRLLFLLPFIAALAHMMKPLIKALAQNNFGIYSDSLNLGVLMPLLSHCMFGFVGGVFGLLAWKAYKKSTLSN